MTVQDFDAIMINSIDDHTIAAIAALVPPPIATFLLTSECTAAGVTHVSHLSPSESEQLPKL